ncbi:MAG: DUF1697 domain-containing protein [Gemmatimonadaceae bacterium]|nr:DUF1697 domain-containing protein [Gemmatimonadaceae bacterium]
MAHVVLLRGVNVGGHRTFRPSALVREMAHLDAVNIGAAGTFVVRARVTRATLLNEFARRLPFATDVAICEGHTVLALIERNPFAGQPTGADLTHFVSVMTRRPSRTLALPFQLPERGEWLLKVIAQEGPFVCGLYKRQMRAVSHLGVLDKRLGVPVTTRNWNTMTAIARVLVEGA